MIDSSRIKDHLIVHAKGTGQLDGSPGVQIGSVDCLERGKYIRMTKNDSHDGRCHWFPVDWVEAVDDEAVYLYMSAEDAMSKLMDKQPG